MKLYEIVKLVNAEICSEEGFDVINKNISYGFSCDLMSDVLTMVDRNVLLITGLVNLQAIRTAEMLDINTILFVRGKKASNELIELAKELDITILSTNMTMYEVSGILYSSGLEPVEV